MRGFEGARGAGTSKRYRVQGLRYKVQGIGFKGAGYKVQGQREWREDRL